MLKNIPSIIPPELMKIMMEMGHGDELLICDGNYPKLGCPERCVRMDGHGIPEILDAILRFFPLDSYVEHPAILMAVLLPAPGQTGTSPFILGFVILATEQIWFASYENTVFSPALACLKGTLEHKKTVKASFVYAGAALLACLLSIPWWRFLGYL